MRKATLTFDNGPEPAVTPQVLDCLAAHNTKATFFVLGWKVSEPARARIAQRASREGHRIGNHTFSHTVPLGELDRDAALGEFERTEQALASFGLPDAEQGPRLFRPYGRSGALGPHLFHPAVIEKLQAGKFTCVLWNCVPGDWKYPDDWVKRAIEDCRQRPWSLVVLHDLPSGAMKHLDEFIRGLKGEGVELTQEYPPDCLPMMKGKLAPGADAYWSSGMRT